MFHQTFDPHDLVVVALLVVLEGVLSIDNALVLGILAKRLPKHLQNKALTYGLVGAFVFRVIAIATASYLLHWSIVKLLGGAYLVYVAVKHFFLDAREPDHEKVAIGPDGHPTLIDTDSGEPLSPEREQSELAERTPVPVSGRATAAFWPTVVAIELTDIAFAVDSIVAAIGVVGPPPIDAPRHPKLWVVVIGGFLGVVLMRFAAVIFIRLLEKFPRFETAAYLLVVVIGLKLVIDWAFNTKENPHRINFHDVSHVEFWVFWLSMATCFAIGFLPKRSASQSNH